MDSVLLERGSEHVLHSLSKQLLGWSACKRLICLMGRNLSENVCPEYLPMFANRWKSIILLLRLQSIDQAVALPAHWYCIRDELDGHWRFALTKEELWMPLRI